MVDDIHVSMVEAQACWRALASSVSLRSCFSFSVSAMGVGYSRRNRMTSKPLLSLVGGI